MATPVVRKMLGTDKKNPGISDDWWVDNDFLPTKAAKVSAETYTALMVKIAAREQESMRQQRIAENRASASGAGKPSSTVYRTVPAPWSTAVTRPCE